MAPHITLEQWRSLIAVVDAGGYAQAAETLFKSQSAVTYAVQKIESLLGVKAFEIQGRKAILTPTGQMLYRRALALVDEANDLERAAHTLSAGWEVVIHIAAEILFPSSLLLACLERFGQESPRTRVELIESVIGGTSDALLKGEVDLAILPQLPPGFLGNLLMRIRLLAVAHADHPLHHHGRELTYRDLRAYRHLVVRDSGAKRDQRAVTVEVDQRWTVGQVATSIQAVCMGYGFAWLPEEHIREELRTGMLRPLPLREGGTREVPLYLVLANPDFAGPGARRLVEIIRKSVDEEYVSEKSESSVQLYRGFFSK
ncbi:DNA-binding transcriptional LysR family regulator [Nitrosospira sp. Nsp5]|uniref:DNA-binding transcriptional regulator, LysR family n=1 Tax=Nitrosospira multiformis TaxID=1231 RepID=A0ABY0TKH3_9PROT|nr:MULTISPECIES: LysR family transcriptional regulator [Nitrosospira]PTR10798.1 DNA-binding transcriptional LysR family regulator [Nitrosospira sp. Nsp5]SDQ74746.1 DNA-binding transcriptional regulator, LysR family [Nitrosospira multiformis]